MPGKKVPEREAVVKCTNDVERPGNTGTVEWSLDLAGWMLLVSFGGVVGREACLRWEVRKCEGEGRQFFLEVLRERELRNGIVLERGMAPKEE